MAIIFDLNTTAPFTDQATWEINAPLDFVMVFAALGRTPEQPASASPEPRRGEPTALEADENGAVTWEDAEWQ